MRTKEVSSVIIGGPGGGDLEPVALSWIHGRCCRLSLLLLLPLMVCSWLKTWLLRQCELLILHLEVMTIQATELLLG